MYAETPGRGFLPGAGTLQRWRPPPAAAPFAFTGDLRLDAGVRQGDEVSRACRGAALLLLRPSGYIMTAVAGSSSVLLYMHTLHHCLRSNPVGARRVTLCQLCGGYGKPVVTSCPCSHHG